MIKKLTCLATTPLVLTMAPSTAEARGNHPRAGHRHLHARDGVPGYRYARTDPRRGYEEAPADPSYQGPGADVFRQTILSAHAPGTALELDPDGKQSATGGPSGGLPNNGNGP